MLLWLLGGCGYKPLGTYTSKVFGESVYAEVAVNIRDPENAVQIKDAINAAVYSRFHDRLARRNVADTYLKIRYDKVKFQPLQYDNNGYAIYYRTTVTLEITYRSPKDEGVITSRGYYDFPIEPNAVISDAKRYEAIQYGSKKALDIFIARVAARGSLK